MNRFLRRALLTCFLAGLFPAVAAAATLPSTTTPSPPPPPPPAGGSLQLKLPAMFVVHHQLVTVPRRGVTVLGIVRPYVADQWVTVTAYVGRHRFKRRRVLIKPAKHGREGRFTLRISSPRPGTVTVAVTHSRSLHQVGFKRHRRFTVLVRGAGFGSTGRFVQLIQQRLAALRIYVRQSGVYDGSTGLAIDAYHRLLGWGTSQQLDSGTISYLLNGWGRFRVHYPSHGKHAEGDLGRQLLALINGSKVYAIYPISSGKPSTPTVMGNFRVYRRVPGFQPDGMFYSSYFTGGYAIHGYNPAPDYPASHGCMRLPIPDAIPVYNWLNFGDRVDVY
ncbi:MAG: L,D-transpeptidase [Solirubrobacterales bacterium]|nr:L,D-transpeptidase [Solirubrobacterales bacterium]